MLNPVKRRFALLLLFLLTFLALCFSCAKDGQAVAVSAPSQVRRCIAPVSYTHLDVYKRQATDSAGGSATRKITFSRTVSRIAAARAFNTDALVQKVFVSLYPATIPADATLHLEVTNNPFDTSPVWVEDVYKRQV